MKTVEEVIVQRQRQHNHMQLDANIFLCQIESVDTKQRTCRVLLLETGNIVDASLNVQTYLSPKKAEAVGNEKAPADQSVFFPAIGSYGVVFRSTESDHVLISVDRWDELNLTIGENNAIQIQLKKDAIKIVFNEDSKVEIDKVGNANVSLKGDFILKSGMNATIESSGSKIKITSGGVELMSVVKALAQALSTMTTPTIAGPMPPVNLTSFVNANVNAKLL